MRCHGKKNHEPCWQPFQSGSAGVLYVPCIAAW